MSLTHFTQLLSSAPVATAPQEPELETKTPTAYAWASMRLSDGEVFQTYRATTATHVASIAKVMTCMVITDLVPDLSQLVTIVDSDVLENPPPRPWVMAGDQVSWYDLIAASMVTSDNHASHALGRAGGYLLDPAAADDTAARAAFVARMNEKKLEIGMSSTSRYEQAWAWAYLTANDVLVNIRHAYLHYATITDTWNLPGPYTVTVHGPNARTFEAVNNVSPANRALVPEYSGGKGGAWNSVRSLGWVWTHKDTGAVYISALCRTPATEDRWADARIVIDNVYVAGL